MVGYFLIKTSNKIIDTNFILVLDRTSIVNKNITQKTYNTYQMFDIFYNNTDGDQFDQLSLSKESFDQN